MIVYHVDRALGFDTVPAGKVIWPDGVPGRDYPDDIRSSVASLILSGFDFVHSLNMTID